MTKGYKVFNPDWTCRKKQYTCPGKFEEDGKLSMCKVGMHFCKRAVDCFNYYGFDPENHVAEVIAYGDVVEDGDKCCTDKLEIVREIPWSELLELVNTGKGNTGCGNSGDGNSGKGNSGCGNSGYGNSGYGNSGYRNSGNGNSGDGNAGNRNAGNRNSGDFNSCDHSSGCFNTKEQTIFLFNKPSEWTYADWMHSKARFLLYDMPSQLEYIGFEDMTDEEIKKHPEAETIGGYLRIEDTIKAANQWWRELNKQNKRIILSIPNFDKDIFRKITGIDVDEIS